MVCKHISTSASAVKHHIEAIHEGVRYPCDKCEYSSTRSSVLRIHIESNHKGLNDFPLTNQC